MTKYKYLVINLLIVLIYSLTLFVVLYKISGGDILFLIILISFVLCHLLFLVLKYYKNKILIMSILGLLLGCLIISILFYSYNKYLESRDVNIEIGL